MSLLACGVSSLATMLEEASLEKCDRRGSCGWMLVFIEQFGTTSLR